MPRHPIAIRAAGASLVALGFTHAAGAWATDPKAGRSDCATAQHAGATLAKVDRDPEERDLVAKGPCRKMGGRLAAPMTGGLPA